MKRRMGNLEQRSNYVAERNTFLFEQNQGLYANLKLKDADIKGYWIPLVTALQVRIKWLYEREGIHDEEQFLGRNQPWKGPSDA